MFGCLALRHCDTERAVLCHYSGAMGVSHIALVAKDMAATHDFYTGPMGFELVKVEIVPKGDGFARHVFYSTGSDDDQMVAFWDLSGVPDVPEFENNINKAMGVE